MATLPFPCTSTPLSAADFQSATTTLGIDAATLWSMLHVETPGCGYLADGRPQILFERHLFSRATNGQWDATHPGISNPVQGGYGPGGAAQYGRLAEAVALNQDAALSSASWGLGQVLGSHYASLKYETVDAMIEAMCASESSQLGAVVGYILQNKLQTALQNKQWAVYAKAYNGPDYAKNQYDVKLAATYAGFSNHPLPDIHVRAAQVYLTLLGHSTNGIDGELGPGTLTALHVFQSKQGLPLTANIDDGVLASIVAAMPAAGNLALS